MVIAIRPCGAGADPDQGQVIVVAPNHRVIFGIFGVGVHGTQDAIGGEPNLWRFTPMSITTLITEKEVKANLDRIIPQYDRTQRVPIRVSHGTGSAALTGTAFDYALRFEIQRRYPESRDKKWIAESAIAKLEKREHLSLPFSSFAPLRDLGRVLRRIRRRVQNARIFLRKHATRRRPDAAWMSRLAEHALRLARIDPIYRAGYLGDEVFASNRNDQIQEVVELLSCVPFNALVGKGSDVLLNPTFGPYSSLVGGADADVIAEGRLIDFKVVAQPNIERGMVRQLVAYLILARCATRDGAKMPAIEELGIYFARHAHLWVLPAARIINHPAYSDVERWFLRYAESRQRRPLAMVGR